MARLDVSHLMTDPDFMDRFTVIKMTQTLVKGRAVNTETATQARGVVMANDGLKLARNMDGSLVSGAITIHTRTKLVSGVAGQDADEIEWNGQRYTVSMVADFSNWGRGFYSTVCQLKPFTGA